MTWESPRQSRKVACCHAGVAEHPSKTSHRGERAGGIRKSGKGDHVNIKMPNGQIITFSGVREPIKIGLLKAMLRKAGITEDEFVQLLEG
jgi:predicted RNA binding protein YcfA (HicA-like mRNA interferase family)